VGEALTGRRSISQLGSLGNGRGIGYHRLAMAVTLRDGDGPNLWGGRGGEKGRLGPCSRVTVTVYWLKNHLRL
jgi:hypothetical protein